MTTQKPRKTAAMLVIGDEVLSGRTQDTNTYTIARWLAARGVDLREGRIVADDECAIVEAVNALRAAYDYLFTTGGIGPTHDDITADSIAAAFGVAIAERADALEILKAHYGPENLNAGRRRMARIPDGATLIANPLTGAPGFQIGNVFVMAGVPKVMKAMLADVDRRIEHGPPRMMRAVVSELPESVLAPALNDIQARYTGLSIGSYPHMGAQASLEGPRSVTVRITGDAAAEVEAARNEVEAAIVARGGAPRRIDEEIDEQADAPE